MLRDVNVFVVERLTALVCSLRVASHEQIGKVNCV